MSVVHCGQLTADRKLGEYWERQFGIIAARHGFMFTPLQIGRSTSAIAYQRNGDEWKRLKLPDIVIWTAPGQCHEIKHKAPTPHGSFGLEAYRFHSLVEFALAVDMDVMYTIHDHSQTGGREEKTNRIDDWLTASILNLGQRQHIEGRQRASYVNGEKVQNIAIYYWPRSSFMPLETYWQKVAVRVPF